MADQNMNKLGNIEHQLQVKKGPETQKEQKSKELESTSKQFVEGTREVVGNMEYVSEGSENVSESTSEDKKQVSNGMPTGKGSAQGIKAQFAQQFKIPTVNIMRRQVAKAIKTEIHHLEKEAKKIKRNPLKFSPFALNGVVSKIRELQSILSQLAYATVENLKSWWMKFVKNISI